MLAAAYLCYLCFFCGQRTNELADVTTNIAPDVLHVVVSTNVANRIALAPAKERREMLHHHIH